jgi:UDP-glucose 4-epimerase
MTKILVTGGKGFIGSHLVDSLLKQNHNVTTFDHSKKKVHYNGWDKVKHIQGSILDEKLINLAIAKSDYTFHLAGILGTSETLENIRPVVESNIIGTLNVLDALKKHNKQGLVITIGGINWLNPYAITKLAAEKFCLMYIKEFNVDVKIVRGLNTYGSRQKEKPVKKAVPNFIINALQNRPIEIYGDGNQIVDLVYIGDLVEVMIRAMKSKKKIHHVIDAGTGIGITVNDLANMIIQLARSSSKIEHLPMRKGEPEQSVTIGNVDTLKEIKYSPSTPVKEGLNKTISWYKNNLLSK